MMEFLNNVLVWAAIDQYHRQEKCIMVLEAESPGSLCQWDIFLMIPLLGCGLWTSVSSSNKKDLTISLASSSNSIC